MYRGGRAERLGTRHPTKESRMAATKTVRKPATHDSQNPVEYLQDVSAS